MFDTNKGGKITFCRNRPSSASQWIMTSNTWPPSSIGGNGGCLNVFGLLWTSSDSGCPEIGSESDALFCVTIVMLIASQMTDIQLLPRERPS